MPDVLERGIWGVVEGGDGVGEENIGEGGRMGGMGKGDFFHIRFLQKVVAFLLLSVFVGEGEGVSFFSFSFFSIKVSPLYLRGLTWFDWGGRDCLCVCVHPRGRGRGVPPFLFF